MDTGKLVFADDTMTVHRVLNDGKSVKAGKDTLYQVESVTLLPGDTIGFDELPPYQQNPLLNDGIKGLSLLDPQEVEHRLAERDRILGLTEATKANM